MITSGMLVHLNLLYLLALLAANFSCDSQNNDRECCRCNTKEELILTFMNVDSDNPSDPLGYNFKEDYRISETYNTTYKPWFESRGYIPLDKILRKLCMLKPLIRISRATIVIKKDKAVWEFEKKIREGKRWNGKYTIVTKNIRFDAKTGRKLRAKREKYTCVPHPFS